MATTEAVGKAHEEIVRILDDLSLQLMVQGAGAVTAEALTSLAGQAKAGACPALETEARASAGKVNAKPLTDEQAQKVVSQLQELFAAGTKVAPAAPEASANSSTTFFKEDPEILADFVMESSEHLAAIEEKILVLEKDPTLIDTVHAVFRAFHTIKGLAGFLGLSGVQAVAHEVETLLDHARNSRIAVTSEVVDLVLESSEYLKEEVAHVQARLNDQPASPIRDNTELLRTLSTATANVAAGRPLLAKAESSAAAATAAIAVAEVPAVAQGPDAEPNEAEGKTASKGKAKGKGKASSKKAPVVAVEPEVLFPAPAQEATQASSVEKTAFVPESLADFFSTPTPAAAVPAALAAAAPVPAQPTLVVKPPVAVVALAAAPVAPAAVPVAEAGGAKAVRVETASSSIRVEVSKLDRLMDMVGELVIAQSILSNSPQLKNDVRLTGEMSQLARITGEVQRSAMSMRMMPIGPLFQKNAKMVRDLSRRNGKQVSLELSGEATELDKTIAEELSDPLLHMIRNALDHGIEEPAERIAAGKTPVASLHIGAEHQAGQIIISISDDGRGLDAQRIRNKAIQNGLVDPATQMSQDEIFKLIFAPGFSTAEKITDISGRGVGMDVVRQHVETLRGRIEIKSELGKGTTFYIYLPLTLAIIEGLVIVVGEHRYVVPVFSVREMFRPTEEMLFTVQGRDEMILIRGELLPLVRLHQRLEIAPRTTDICEGLLVVCEFGGKRYCLFVDDLLGRQEIVIKSLDHAFQKIKGLSGSAILGDGRIGLILDVAGIFHGLPAEKEPLAA